MIVPRTVLLFCIVFTSLSFHCFAQSEIITTVIAGDNNSFAGRQFALIPGLSDVSVDSSGNLFISDQRKNCVLKVTPDGKSTVVAGKGTTGNRVNYAGYGLSSPVVAGGKATEAQLTMPSSVVVDFSGNLYFVEGDRHNRICKVTPDGTIATIVGNEKGGRGIFQSSRLLTIIKSLTVDSAGNLYYVEEDTPPGGAFQTGPDPHRVLKFSDGAITTVVEFDRNRFYGPSRGMTTAQPFVPSRVAVDSAGNLFVADEYSNSLYKLTSNGKVPIVEGIKSSSSGGWNGKPDLSRLNSQGNMVVDSAGNLYVADQGNHRVCKVTPDGKIINIAGTGQKGFSGDDGPATAARLSSPASVALDSAGNVYIADSGNNRIRKVAQSSSQSSKKPGQ